MRRRPPSKSSASGTTRATLAVSMPGIARSARQQVVVELRPALARVVEHRRIDGGDEDAASVENRRRAARRPAGCGRTGRRARAVPPRARPGRRRASRGAGGDAPDPAACRAGSRCGGGRGWPGNAGASPKAIAVMAVVAMVAASTVPSMPKSSRTGSGRGGCSCSSAASIHCASARPAPAASTASRQRLDEQLAHEPAAARAERQPHRELLLPIGRAGDEQAGDVGACDQQHQRQPSAQHQEEAGDRPDGVRRQPQGLLSGATVTRRAAPRTSVHSRRVGRVQTLRDRAQLRLGLGQRGAIGKAADDGAMPRFPRSVARTAVIGSTRKRSRSRPRVRPV